MFSKKNLQNIATIFLIFITLFSTLTNKLLAQNSAAYNDVRDTVGKDYGCNENTEADEETQHDKTCYTSNYDEDKGMCDKGDFKFDPYGPTIDKEWNIYNEACLGFILGTGVALKLSFDACRPLCFQPPIDPKDFKQALKKATQSKFTRALNSAASTTQNVASAGASSVAGALFGIPLDPTILYDLGRFTAKCITGSPPEKATCCPALMSCGAVAAAAVVTLSLIWESARDSFYKTVICGNGWKSWKQDVQTGSDTINQWKTIDGNYATCLKTIFGNTVYCAPGTNKPDGCRVGLKEPKCNGSITNITQERYCKFTNNNPVCSIDNVIANNGEDYKNDDRDYKNRYYREFIFKGIEYTDNGSSPCKNPVGEEWEATLGYNPSEGSGNQKYYFKGPNQQPNFACNRFLAKGVKNKEGLRAFGCCQEASQKTICLEKIDGSHRDYKFCRRGGECSASLTSSGISTSLPVKYKIFESEKSSNFICAQTYSACPYDHNVQGGTDVLQQYYYNPKIISNFCQYMNHCIKLPPISKPSFFDPSTFFFAESCKDLRGDSQFFHESELGRMSKFSSLYSRNFSAPIVQCFKETLENHFMQKTGKTICIDEEEIPKKTKANPDGVCDSGYAQHKGDVKNQTFFTKVQKRFLIPIKIALVLSVVMFGFNILLATPETFINKKTVMTYLVKFGLVYFFVIGNAWQGFFMDSVMNLSSEFSNITFSPKSTKDKSSPNDDGDGCNFPKYNHLSLLEPDLRPDQDKTTRQSKINTIKINPKYPPGKNYLRIWDTLDCKIARAIGYAPDVSVPNLAKMIFAGFLTGGLGIMFFFAAFAYGLMLISIAMRAIHITIMSIVGVILLIYVSPLTITCALFERTKGIFENWWKQMLGFIFQPMILFAYLGLMLTVFDDLFIGDATFGANEKINCEKNNVTRSNPEENSVYCILQPSKYKSYNGLEVFDLAIPILLSMNKEKINTLTRAAIIMFVFLKFLDKITTVARKLVGGPQINDSTNSNIQNQLKKIAKGVQSRALNTTKKLATKSLGHAKKAIRSDEKNPMPKMEGEAKVNNNDAVGEGK